MPPESAAPPVTHLDPRADPSRRWWALATLAFSLIIAMSDNSVANVALPSIVRGTNADNSQLQWIVDAYVIVFAGLVLTTGTIGDRYGRKGVMLLGYGVVGAAAIMATLSSTAGSLIASRAVMGVGGAMILPATLSILPTLFPDKDELAKAFGVWAGASGVGSVLGPTIGGFLVDSCGWRSVFWINLPFLAVALPAALLLVPKSRAAQPARPDPIGALLSTVGLAVTLWAVIGGPNRGWTSAGTLVSGAVGALTLAGFVLWELRTEEPMLDLRVFRSTMLGAAVTAIGIGYLCLGSSLFYTTQYLQFVLSWSALKSGVAVIPFALSVGISAPLSTRLSRRWGLRAVTAGGLGLITLGLVCQAWLADGKTYTSTLLLLVLAGSGIGFGTAQATRIIINCLPENRTGVASAINDLVHEVGVAIGIAVLGTVLAAGYRHRLSDSLASLNLPAAQHKHAEDGIAGALSVANQLSSGGGQLVADAARSAFIDAMSTGLWVAACGAALATILALRLPKRAVDLPPSPQLETPAETVDQLPSTSV